MLARRGDELAGLHLAAAAGWSGPAADVAALARLDLGGRVQRMAEAYAEAAVVVARCEAEREHADALRRRAEGLLEQHAAAVRARAVQRAAGVAVPPEDDELRRAAHRLLDEADDVVAAAERRAAAELDMLRPARSLTLREQVAGFGRGLWASAGEVARLARLVEPLDPLLRPEAHQREGREALQGLLFAAEHPRQAVGAALGEDQLRGGAYGEWLGAMLAGSVVPGGRVGHAAGRLGRMVDAGGPVVVPRRLRLPEAFPRHIADLRPDRRRHILDGEGPKKGGGHRPGLGKPGKTEFPAGWSDDDIISCVMQTAMRPERVEVTRGQFAAFADYDGATVKVVISVDGDVITAYPLPGGRGIVQNPGAW
ncbi:MAG: Bacterial EndoU nuclease [Frankiales bacterium]|nr:Bacterial EndoU nuclease [Frankiales bacterium]